MEVFPRFKEREGVSLKPLSRSLLVKRLRLVVVMVSASTFMPIYAASQLTDAELDTKFLDVPQKSPYFSKKESDNPAADTSSTFEQAQIALNRSADLSGPNPLLSGLEQKIRSLGTAEVVGVPTGVANSAADLPFGAENYSFKWAGNIDQVYVVPATNIEYLQTIYGADADFYLAKPQVVRIEATTHRTN